MALLKRESLREIEDLFDRSTLSLPWPFGRGGSGMPGLPLQDWQPRVDISESAGGYEVRVDIPGVLKDDLRVTLQDGVLTIEGERRQEKKEESERLHRIERVYGSFSSCFHLPDDADGAAMKATARDGQLTVTIPRRGPAPSESPMQIPVQ